MKNVLESLIKAERAMEQATVQLLTHAEHYKTERDNNCVDICMREYRNVDKAQEELRRIKLRLQALAE